MIIKIFFLRAFDPLRKIILNIINFCKKLKNEFNNTFIFKSKYLYYFLFCMKIFYSPPDIFFQKSKIKRTSPDYSVYFITSYKNYFFYYHFTSCYKTDPINI